MQIFDFHRIMTDALMLTGLKQIRSYDTASYSKQNQIFNQRTKLFRTTLSWTTGQTRFADISHVIICSNLTW